MDEDYLGLLDWHASWYRPGDWSLPDWWTNSPPVRDGNATHAEQVAFYSGPFVVNVLKHEGGITTLPRSTK